MTKIFYKSTLIFLVLLFIFLAFPIFIVPSSLPALKAVMSEENAVTLTPQELSIESSPTTLSLTWYTQTPTQTTITYGRDPKTLNQTLTTPETQTYHNLIIKNLKPATTYFFHFTTENIVFTNQGRVFQASTLATPTQPLPKDDQAVGIYELTLPEIFNGSIDKIKTLKTLHQKGLDKIF